MKKFLSLVLAMIMTMSLVTISAGATEYKDLTDKDEIQYEEAVAVLNRIGVITGYDDGSFRPETELTRGAAAKIIVSLMIGPDAASALPNVSSPYPDVPASHTFAGVISFCKTEKYISGYSDGTFKPADPLTGYAFAKMLLGAIGYSSDIEGFTGSGWTMNVARIGNVAGLFDRISFNGGEAVTRDQACQLALNTLKATMVTYGGTSIINGSTGSYTIQGTEANPITSNNRDINANIGRKDWYGGNNQNSDYLTLEFGEEHFKDLRLEHDRFDPAHDDFGRPSNEWSYKKVTIGTFPLEADYTYTTQVAHVEDTDGTKEKALGLRNFDTYADGGYSVWQGWGNTGDTASAAYNNGFTSLWLNGLEDRSFFREQVENKLVHGVADIADYTDNGTRVEVYVSSIDADWITDVVVIQTQLMEVKKVASDYVALDQLEPDVLEERYLTGEPYVGYNRAAIDVKLEQVKDTNEDCYSILSGLKEGDEVAVIPVTTDSGKTYEAAKVYVPETVSGSLTRVDTYGIAGGDDDRNAISITVGGTEYKIANWNKDMRDLTVEKIKATRKDVTLLMDEYGNAMLAKDVGSTNDFMVIGNFYQALSGNKICTYVHGWDISGTELDLNLGSSVKVDSHNGNKSVYGHVIGELVKYTSDGVSSDADYRLAHTDVYDVYTNLKETNGEREKVADNVATFEIKASNLMVPLADKKTNGDTIDGNYHVYDITNYQDVDYHNYYFDKSVKFIYVSAEKDEDEVDSIEFKDGAQNVSHTDLRQDIMGWTAQACVKDDQVKAVVIKRESSDASLDKMLYVTKYIGMKEYDKETGEKGYEIEALMYKDGKWNANQRIIVDKDLRIGAFATYSPRESTKYAENYYHVKNFTRHNANPSALYASEVGRVNVAENVNTKDRWSKALLRLQGDVTTITTSGAASGTKLTAINSGAANFNNPAETDSYVLGNYRGVSTTIDTYTKPEGIINAKNAYFLNMVDSKRTYVENGITKSWRDVDIDDVEDLRNLVLDEGLQASVTVLLNEKADSDGFRTAYLVVINDIYEGSNSGPASGDGIVKLGTGMNSMVKSIGGGISTVYNDGTIGVSDITLTAPDWADKATNNLTGGVKLTLKTADGKSFSASTTNELIPNAKISYDTTKRVYTIDLTGSAIEAALANSRNAEALKDCYIEVAEVNWDSVKVKIEGDATIDETYVSTTTPGTDITSSHKIVTDDNKYTGTYNWVITGAKSATVKDSKGTASVGTTGAITGADWIADGDGYVTITISGLTSNPAAKHTISGLSAVDLTKPDGTKMTGGLTFTVVDAATGGGQLGAAVSNGIWQSATDTDDAYIQLAAASSSGSVSSWTVTGTVTPKSGSAVPFTVTVPDSGNATIKHLFTMDTDYTVAITSAVPVAALKVEGTVNYDVNGHITVNFNEPLAAGFGKSCINWGTSGFVLVPNSDAAIRISPDRKSVTLDVDNSTATTANPTFTITNGAGGETVSVSVVYTVPTYTITAPTSIANLTDATIAIRNSNDDADITKIAPGGTFKIKVTVASAVTVGSGTTAPPYFTVSGVTVTGVSGGTAATDGGSDATITWSGSSSDTVWTSDVTPDGSSAVSLKAASEIVFTCTAPSTVGTAITPVIEFTNGLYT